jgi:hypothetical protein
MKDQKKAKWILGGSGVILSALLLSQFNDGEQFTSNAAMNEFTKEQEKNMSEREKELVSLDWTNFELMTMNQQQSKIQSDRKTRNS